MPRAVAHLQEALPRGAPAARESVAPVLARELDPELLEPVDRARRLACQNLDELAVRGFVRALPDIFGVLCGRVVLAESGLNPALGLGRVAGLEGAFRDERDACSLALGGDGRGQSGGSAPDHEHVENLGGGHRGDYTTVF